MTLGIKSCKPRQRRISDQMKFKAVVSTIVDVSLDEVDISPEFDTWLREYATFVHTDSYEFIHHLFLEESENWFLNNRIKKDVLPEGLLKVILDARKAKHPRICFFA